MYSYDYFIGLKSTNFKWRFTHRDARPVNNSFINSKSWLGHCNNPRLHLQCLHPGEYASQLCLHLQHPQVVLPPRAIFSLPGLCCMYDCHLSRKKALRRLSQCYGSNPGWAEIGADYQGQLVDESALEKGGPRTETAPPTNFTFTLTLPDI